MFLQPLPPAGRSRSLTVDRETARLLAWLLFAAVLVLVGVQTAEAQRGLPLDRPGDMPLELPPFEPSDKPPGSILPPVPLPEEPDTRGLTGGRRVFVREIAIEGNTALPTQTLSAIAAPYQNRQLSLAEIEEVRDRLTLAYVERGYISSGATVPAQSLDDGILEIQIVEGELSEIDVETDGRFRPSYIRDRVALAARTPVNLYEIERQLQVLRQDHRIRGVQAEFEPGDLRGTSRLNVAIKEEKPYSARLELSNHESPTVGAYRAEIDLGYDNITGYGDGISAMYAETEGLRDIDLAYEIPISAYDASLRLHFETIRSKIIEQPFDALDIKNRSYTYGVTVTQPAYRSDRTTFSLFLTGELRRSKSYLLGRGFSFTPGQEDGVSKVAVLRFGQYWTYRERRYVFALRSMVTWGLDVLGATHHSGDIPDGQFVACLGQFQWAYRLRPLNAQALVRADVQIADSSLLGLEQFSIGGHSTVRGYRENLLVRDNGLIGSLEFRLPVLSNSTGIAVLELSPFVDAGYSWSHDKTVGPTTLVSAGVGVHWRPTDWLDAQLSWAEEFKEVPRVTDWDLQDSGFEFQVTLRLP